MTADQARLNLLEATIRKRRPKYNVKYKNESGWQKFIAVLAYVFNPKYLTNYITVDWVSCTVWWTTKESFESNPGGAFKTLTHEYVHMLEPKWIQFGYTLPQVLAGLGIISLLAIWFSLWWLMGLCALLFLLPLPSYGRMKIELRGYTMSMAVNYWKHGSIQDSTKDWIVKQFTERWYYFMWPFAKNMRKRLEEMAKKIENDEVLKVSPAFAEVKAIVALSDREAIDEAKALAA